MAKYELPKWQEPTYDMGALNKEAGAAINPQYDTQIAGVVGQRNTATNQLNTTRDTLMSDYAKRVADIGIDTHMGKNQFSHSANSRGLGRSSIVTSGLEGIGIRGEKRVDESNTERDKYVGQAQSAYDTTLQNLSQQESTINTNRSTALQAYIDNLKERQYNRARDAYQTEYQRISDLIAKQEREAQIKREEEQRKIDNAFREKQLAEQKRQAASRSSGGGTSKQKQSTSQQKNIAGLVNSSSYSNYEKLRIIEQEIRDTKSSSYKAQLYEARDTVNAAARKAEKKPGAVATQSSKGTGSIGTNYGGAVGGSRFWR